MREIHGPDGKTMWRLPVSISPDKANCICSAKSILFLLWVPYPNKLTKKRKKKIRKNEAQHDYKGTVYCYCPETLKQREMAYGGFEKDRGTLKYRCPAKQYGVECKGKDNCPVASGIRISLDEDRRIFTPLARSSYKWEEIYKTRTAVERVNSRLDEAFGFEKHFIRGLTKMRVRCGLALTVMLAMALGKIKEKHGNPRSLVEAA